MAENFDDRVCDVNMSASGITFDNLIILKECSNIVNLVRNEDFLETVPKAKLKRVKWVPMFSCLKQGIFDDMVQELSSMWKYEDMPSKLEVLEKQKEKFHELNAVKMMWRPQIADVKSQLKNHDIVNLQRQKKSLESLAKEYEVRVHKLKKNVTAKRGYLKALQLKIQKYQQKNEDLISKLNTKFEDQKNIIKQGITTKVHDDEMFWKN